VISGKTTYEPERQALLVADAALEAEIAAYLEKSA
jgi:hypothetical protein